MLFRSAAISGPSFHASLSQLWPVTAVLRTFAMRFHVNVELNPTKLDNVDAAMLRVGYLLGVAKRLHLIAEELRRPLWRAVLVTTKVKEVPPTDPACLVKGSKITARVTWEREAVVRYCDPVCRASDQAGVTDAIKSTIEELAQRFNEGGYDGGRWAGKTLIEGPKPPELPEFPVELQNKFVLGEYYDAVSNVLAPVRNAIEALRS